jgi:hypothetical protein
MYETSWHHKWICEVIQRGYDERKNVIIECHPRSGKSEIANVHAPASRFDAGVYDEMFMQVSNSDNLATKFSVGCRNLCKLPLEVDRDSQWKIRGLESLNFSYHAAGIRGQITGHGCSVLILDDLLKSGLEAKSDTFRENVWENIVSAAINRLTPDGIIVALQARLHRQDTIGKLLEQEHLRFLHLHLPATNDDGRSAFFRDGYSGEEVIFPAYDALWPTRYNRAKLDEIKKTVTPYWWQAQYMAEPSMGDLGYFMMDRCPTYQSSQVQACWIAVDAAQTETASGSFTAFVCLGILDNQLKVLCVERGRWRQDVIQQKLYDFYQAMTRLTGQAPIKVIVERAAAGYGIIDCMSRVLPILPTVPQGSKEDRAGAVCYLVNNGQVALPESASWLKPFREELENFPLSSSADMTDAFVHACKLMTTSLDSPEFRFPTQTGVEVYDSMAVLKEEYMENWRYNDWLKHGRHHDF